MGRELQFEIVRVFKGKSPIYRLCHRKEPLGQCLVLLLGKGGCFTSLPYAALSVRGAEYETAGQGLVWQRIPSPQ